MKLLAIDPGSTVTGYAVFDVPDPAPKLELLLGAHLHDFGRVKFKSHSPDRKDLLYGELATFYRRVEARSGPIHRTVIERPSYAGRYRHKRRSLKSIAGLYMMIGLQVAAAAQETHSAEVELHDAAEVSKKHRATIVKPIVGQAISEGRWDSDGPCRELLEELDVTDALYLGVHYVHHKMQGE